ncbi:MAG: PAS domain-containing protein [Rhodobacterales bacterium]|nr:PAS domain-containing protein [Rhodobacterales bacterium]MDX5411733.1 PAS domain-containing protein [Rhodobacterales bacterium]
MRRDGNPPFPGPDSNVIVMSRHRTDARFPHIATVEAYWHALRGRRAVPRRAEVDPRGIENALEYAFIAEHVAPGIGRLRIAGGHLADILGMEVRGMPLSGFFLPGARSDLAACIEKVCTDPTIATLTLQAEPGIGKPVLEARLLLLPLCDEAGEVNRILGCLDSNGSIGRSPRRFSILSRRLTQITGTDVARDWQSPRLQERSGAAVRGFADQPSAFIGCKDDTARRPLSQHLRLVTSQD